MPAIVRRYSGTGRLAIVRRNPLLAPLAGRPRRLADERAAQIARGLVVRDVTGARDYTLSTSHTEGSAAVLRWSEKRLSGVDLVRVTRVTLRHAEAVLTYEDWSALENSPVYLRPALGWAIKEATAKATGAAQRHFPMGIRVVPGESDGMVRARCMGEMRSLFDATWLHLGDLLCVTVVECQTGRSRPTHIHQVECERLPGMNGDLDENMFTVMTCSVPRLADFVASCSISDRFELPG